MNYHNSAAMLLEIRTNPNTPAEVLAADWLNMTLKGAMGGEAFSMRFYSVRGEEVAPSLTVEMADDTEYSLAEMLRAGTGDSTSLAQTWGANYWPSTVQKIAKINISNLADTIYVGHGAVGSKPHGILPGSTFTIAIANSATTEVLANTSYGIGA